MLKNLLFFFLILKSLSTIFNFSQFRSNERHERNTIDTNATQVRHECYTNNTSATQVKNFDFDNDTIKNIFSHTYIYYMASERPQGEE